MTTWWHCETACADTSDYWELEREARDDDGVPFDECCFRFGASRCSRTTGGRRLRVGAAAAGDSSTAVWASRGAAASRCGAAEAVLCSSY